MTGVPPTPGIQPSLDETPVGGLVQLMVGEVQVLARHWGYGVCVPEAIRDRVRPLLREAFGNGQDPLSHIVIALLLQGAWPGRTYARIMVVGAPPSGKPMAPFHKIRVIAARSENIFFILYDNLFRFTF